MKPFLIVGIQLLVLILVLYATAFIVYILEDHWSAYPTYVLCCTLFMLLLSGIIFTIQSYLPPRT